MPGRATGGSPARRCRSPTASCSSPPTHATMRWPRTWWSRAARASCTSASTTRFGGEARRRLPPRGAGALPDDAEAILCIGTDFRHKNRRVRAADARASSSVATTGTGCLLLVGPARRAGLLGRRRGRAAGAASASSPTPCVDFAAVSEAEKEWLYARVAARALPDRVRGLRPGPVRGRRPRRAVPVGARDVAQRGAARSPRPGSSPWDAAASADRALELMRDEDARARQCRRRFARAAAALTWDATAARADRDLRRDVRRAATPASAIERRHGADERRVQRGRDATDRSRRSTAARTSSGRCWRWPRTRRSATPMFRALKSATAPRIGAPRGAGTWPTRDSAALDLERVREVDGAAARVAA